MDRPARVRLVSPQFATPSLAPELVPRSAGLGSRGLSATCWLTIPRLWLPQSDRYQRRPLHEPQARPPQSRRVVKLR